MRILFTIISALLSLTGLASNPRTIDIAIEKANAYVDTNPDSALLTVDNIEKEYPDRLTVADKASLALVRANASFSAGDMPGSIVAIRHAVEISRQADDPDLLIQSLSDAGVMYRVNQNPDSALICYNEALDLMRSHGAEADDEAHLLISIAILFINTNRMTSAVPYARRAVLLAEKSNSLETMMYALSQGGLILFKAGYTDEGLALLRKIVSLSESQGAPRYALKAYAAIIDMHYKQGRKDSVMEYINRGNRLMDRVPQGSVESIGFMEESYVVLSAMCKYRESLAIQCKILDMKDADTYMPMDKLWVRIARNYQALGEYGNMANAYERSIAVSDSLRAIHIDEQLSEFEVKYDTMRTQLENIQLQNERSRTIIGITVVGSVLVLVVVSLTAYIFIRRRREAYLRIEERLKGVDEERARLARELHDGVCNDIYGVSLMLASKSTDKKEIVDELKSISEDIRNISHELMPPRFADIDLDELLTDYAGRSGGFLEYHALNTEAPSVSNETSFQIYRIVQELVQNIHKHTLAKSAILTSGYEHNKLRLTLAYHYAGPVRDSNDNGIGLDNILHRAELINARISHHYDSDTDTHTITIVIDE